jgi:hypothetical protein
MAESTAQFIKRLQKMGIVGTDKATQKKADTYLKNKKSSGSSSTKTPAPVAAPKTSSYSGSSIVDYLGSTGQASDYNTRANLANQYGISNYTGTAAQNTKLLNTLKGGGGARGDDFADAYSSVYGDIPASTDNTGTIESLRNSGLSDQEIADRLRNQEFEMAGGGNYGGNAPAPGLSPTKARDLAKQYGLSGFKGIDFTGMSSSAATKKAQELQNKYKTQTSQLTSYTYNPETMTGVKKATDNFQLALNNINVLPWTKGGTKQDNINTQLAVTASELAKNWTDSQSFLRDFTSNPDIQNSLQGFINAGGTKEQVLESIQKNSVQYTPQAGDMNTADFLANMSPEQQQGYVEAVQSLTLEKQIAQDQIAGLSGIAEEMRDYYFGTPERMGILERREIEAKETQRILKEREMDAKTTLKEKANLQTEIIKTQLVETQSRIEKNRLTAKNYMTGMLAKMGALNTTTASAQALVELDTKYQEQYNKVESEANFAMQGIEINLSNDINEVENDTDERINAVEQDLTKTNEEITREIMKAEQNSRSKIYTIMNSYATKLRTQTDKYTTKYEKLAQDYAKAFATTASGGLDLQALSSSLGGQEVGEGEYIVAGKQKGVLSPTGEIIPFTLTPTQQQQVQNGRINGIEAMKYFLALPTAFRNEWIQAVAGSQDVYEISRVREAYKEWSKEKETEKNTKKDDAPVNPCDRYTSRGRACPAEVQAKAKELGFN